MEGNRSNTQFPLLLIAVNLSHVPDISSMYLQFGVKIQRICITRCFNFCFLKCNSQ